MGWTVIKGHLLKDDPILMHLSVNLRNQAREVTDVATDRHCDFLSSLWCFSGISAQCHLHVICVVFYLCVGINIFSLLTVMILQIERNRISQCLYCRGNVPVSEIQTNSSKALHHEMKLFFSSQTRREDVFNCNPPRDHNAFLSCAEGLWRLWSHRCFRLHDSECWTPFRMPCLSHCRLLYFFSLL